MRVFRIHVLKMPILSHRFTNNSPNIFLSRDQSVNCALSSHAPTTDKPSHTATFLPAFPTDILYHSALTHYVMGQQCYVVINKTRGHSSRVKCCGFRHLPGVKLGLWHVIRLTSNFGSAHQVWENAQEWKYLFMRGGRGSREVRKENKLIAHIFDTFLATLFFSG